MTAKMVMDAAKAYVPSQSGPSFFSLKMCKLRPRKVNWSDQANMTQPHGLAQSEPVELPWILHPAMLGFSVVSTDPQHSHSSLRVPFQRISTKSYQDLYFLIIHSCSVDEASDLDRIQI